jgi:hypothetical protein
LAGVLAVNVHRVFVVVVKDFFFQRKSVEFAAATLQREVNVLDLAVSQDGVSVSGGLSNFLL